MRGAVAVDVDRLDLDLAYFDVLAYALEEHIRFKLIAVAGTVEQIGNERHGNPAQAGLGVGYPASRHEAQQVHDDEISDPAPKWNLPSEGSDSQDQGSGTVSKRLDDPKGVSGGVLTVRVRRDHSDAVGKQPRDVSQAGLQRRTFSEVLAVTDDKGFVEFGKAIEQRVEFRPASVIHNDYRPNKSARCEGFQEFRESLRRSVGRNEYHGAFVSHVSPLSIRRQNMPGPVSRFDQRIDHFIAGVDRQGMPIGGNRPVDQLQHPLG